MASVPELRGCHSQAKSLNTLMKRIREAIALCLEVEGEEESSQEFMGSSAFGAKEDETTTAQRPRTEDRVAQGRLAGR